MKCLRPITYLAVCLALLALNLLIPSIPAHATGSHGTTPPTPPAPQSSAQSLSGAVSISSAHSNASSKSKSQSASSAKQSLNNSNSATGGSSRASQHQTATGGNSTVKDSGNSLASIGPTSTTQTSADVQTVSVSGDEAPRIPVSTAIAGGTNTTASCHYSVGAGGQGTALGLSLGFGRKDKDCERFELAQFLYARGQDVAGDRLMCQISRLKEALGSDCLAMVHQIQVVDSRLIKRQEFERVNK